MRCPHGVQHMVGSSPLTAGLRPSRWDADARLTGCRDHPCQSRPRGQSISLGRFVVLGMSKQDRSISGRGFVKEGPRSPHVIGGALPPAHDQRPRWLRTVDGLVIRAATRAHGCQSDQPSRIPAPLTDRSLPRGSPSRPFDTGSLHVTGHCPWCGDALEQGERADGRQREFCGDAHRKAYARREEAARKARASLEQLRDEGRLTIGHRGGRRS